MSDPLSSGMDSVYRPGIGGSAFGMGGGKGMSADSTPWSMPPGSGPSGWPDGGFIFRVSHCCVIRFVGRFCSLWKGTTLVQ